MPAQTTAGFPPLPRSHYFLTVSRGTGMRTFGVRAFVVHGLLCLVPLLGLIGAGSTAYIVFHDEVVASLMARQSRMQYAYEDRLDALRGELERNAAQYAGERLGFDHKLRDLAVRESKLESRADIVASLADLGGTSDARTGRQASTLPKAVRSPPAATSRAGLPEAALGYAMAEPLPVDQPFSAKPRPEATTLSPRTSPESLSALLPAERSLPAGLSIAAATLDKVEQSQVSAVLRIGAAARAETDRMRATLDDVGLTSDRFPRQVETGQGGPFVPLPSGGTSPFDQAVAKLQDTIAGAHRLRVVVERVPLAVPLSGRPEVTSPFGARPDPFLGRPALHTGVDFKEGFGTEVTATAAGRVIAAAMMGGYGNMVEIDHGNGLTTRYAHLEEILVVPGQAVTRDAIVGRVGATGRATGPHLHYEVRVDNEPVDPLRFINAGFRLTAR